MNQSETNITSIPCAGRSRGVVFAFLVIAITMLTADLVLKWWAFDPVELTRHNTAMATHIPPHSTVRAIPGVLNLKLTWNEGAVFGLGQGGRWFFIAITVIAVVTIVTIFGRSPRNHRALHMALALILAGAIGNLYDRICFGAVRDMLHLFPGKKLPFNLHWMGGSDEVYPWIFNLADAALCIGVGLILLTLLRKRSVSE